MYLSLYCKFVCERELETEQNCNILTPHSYGRQRCVFLVLQGCSTGGPGAQLSAGWWLSLLHLITNWSPKLHRGSRGPLWLGVAFPTTSYLRRLWSPTHQGPQRPPPPDFLDHILSATSLDPDCLTSNSIGGPEGPFGRVWLSLPHLISNSIRSLTVWLPVLTELYTSSTPTQFLGCPRGVMVKAMHCGIVVREFVLQSRYYIHFRANTLGKGMNPLILPPAMGK